MEVWNRKLNVTNWLLQALGMACLMAWQGVSAQPWPAKPIRLVVALPAGSGADLVARLIAPGLGERLNQTIIVDNRPGGADNIGMESVARSAPDGHTLLLAVTSLVTNPHLYRLNYDPVKDLTAVSQLANTHYVLAAHPSIPVRSVRDVIAMAKARPGAMTCAHAAGALHIACAWFKAETAADITLVPYKGSVQALNDVIGGHADLIYGVVHTIVPQARSGRVKVLATTNPRRGIGPFGDMPTMAETYPGFDLVSWLGVVAPSGTTRDTISRLNRDIGSVLGEPGVKKRMAEGGLEVTASSSEAFAEVIRRDYAKYEAIIRKTGIRVE
jgi:tripartite-type tricarboxylate transporter receptor subunit TctC